ncbi:secG [Symbiodinium sp. CCMP2456]|nr:secG [Symbiodinium sp. CCMP2456]
MFQQDLRSQSLPEGLTNIFADDFFGSWIVRDSPALAKAIRAIGVLVATLQRVGLQLSMEKTVILLALGGTSAPSVLAKHRVYIEDESHLVIPVGQQRLPFKIVTSHRYLGAKLAYKGFELLNLRHRLDVAWGSLWRLHSIFKARTLSLGTKVDDPWYVLCQQKQDSQLRSAKQDLEEEPPSQEVMGKEVEVPRAQSAPRMDLEGVSRDELLEAAAELQHIQTMAIQGHTFFGPAQVQNPQRHSESRQLPRPSQFPPQPKYPKTNNGKGTDAGKGNPRSRVSASDSLVEHMAQIMFLGTAPPRTTLPLLHQIGTEWHRMKAEDPASLQQPMRVILYQTWANEFRKRVHELETDQDKSQEAIRRGILTESGHFKFVRWNRETQALQEVTTIAPLSLQEVLSLLDETIVLSIVDGVIVNFHPTRQLAEHMTGPTVTFSLTVGLREPKAFRFWSIMEALSGSASLQLVATTLRRERRQRSALAQTIAQELRRRPLCSKYANLP